MKSAKLKPCPFCGRRAHLLKQAYRYRQAVRDHYGAVCINTRCCGGRLEYFWLTERGAVRAWNRRALLPEGESDG